MTETRTGPTLLLSDITLSAVQAEATRAHLLHGRSSMLYGTDERRLRILVEEIGEVARELNDADIEGRPADRDKIVKELIQSAAMCLTWVEAKEGQHSPPEGGQGGTFGGAAGSAGGGGRSRP